MMQKKEKRPFKDNRKYISERSKFLYNYNNYIKSSTFTNNILGKENVKRLVSWYVRNF